MRSAVVLVALAICGAAILLAPPSRSGANIVTIERIQFEVDLDSEDVGLLRANGMNWGLVGDSIAFRWDVLDRDSTQLPVTIDVEVSDPAVAAYRAGPGNFGWLVLLGAGRTGLVVRVRLRGPAVHTTFLPRERSRVTHAE